MLSDVLRLEIGVCQQACSNGLEAGIWCRQEDTGDIDDVSRVDPTCQGSVTVDGERPRYVPYRNLVRHLLDLDLLKRQELRRPSGQEQLSLGVVGVTFVGGALDHRSELLRGDRLKDLTPASIARVCIDLDRGFHVGNSRCDASNCDEMTEMFPANVADGQSFLITLATRPGWRQGLEVEGVSSSELGRKDGRRKRCVEVVLRCHGHCLIPPVPLRHDDVEDIIFETSYIKLVPMTNRI